MAKQSKTSKEDVQRRRELLIETVREKKYKTKYAILEDLNKLLPENDLNEISLPTISRDLEILQIVKPKGQEHYVYKVDVKEKYDRNSIIAAIKKDVKERPISDIEIIAIRVTEDMADIIGKKIMSLYVNRFIGYIPTPNYVLMLAKGSQNSKGSEKSHAKKVLDDLLYKSSSR